MVALAWLCVLTSLLHLAEASFQEFGRRLPKRRCYQCNMPFQCETGSCYGDMCVKSLASGRYVSKGCENFTSSYYGREASRDPLKIEPASCKTENIFGVESVVCTCADADFCNAGERSFHDVTVLSLLVVLFALRPPV